MVLKRFVELYKGSSCPVRIETREGATCVLKMKGAGNGIKSLIAEFVVSRVAGHHDWPVPAVFPVEIPSGFPWEFGTDEFDDLVQKSYGLNLGLRYLGGALPVAEASSLPQLFLEQMTALDVLFCNYDRTAQSANVLKNEQLWLVDHGSCLFYQRSISQLPLELAQNHLLAGVGPLLREKFAQIAAPEPIEQALHEIPEVWLEEAGLSMDEVKSNLLERARLMSF